jgi:hypothetical protein
MRKGEAAHLTWGDVDLSKALVSLDENKTDRPRSWVLDPSVCKVLAAWNKLRGKPKGDAAVFGDVAWDKLAPAYRAHCEAVGVNRARLFQAKANKLRLRAHDMRAFFITAGVFAGRDALWITDRSGHTTLGMLRRYERDVRRWRELGEAAPVDAHASIPELTDTNVSANVSANRAGRDRRGNVTTRKCTGGESNPYALRRRNLKPISRSRILGRSRKQARSTIRETPRRPRLRAPGGNRGAIRTPSRPRWRRLSRGPQRLVASTS